MEYDNYAERRRNHIYYKVIKNVLETIVNNSSKSPESIIDVGSADTDMLSDLAIKKKVALDIREHPNTGNGVENICADWLTYNTNGKFDIVCCFQVLEHIEDAASFAKKLLSSGKIVLISVPYKWRVGAAKSHVQDPVDEFKVCGWTDQLPDFQFIIQENHGEQLRRIFLAYFQDKNEALNIFKHLKEFEIFKNILPEPVLPPRKHHSFWWHLVRLKF